ncbi:Uncharacterised protein [Mycobacteroides abscessus subsp. abscessus]|nr:Uncharacterised protein [Mycobacteroides abscessus subsp. abscessus]
MCALDNFDIQTHSHAFTVPGDRRSAPFGVLQRSGTEIDS